MAGAQSSPSQALDFLTLLQNLKVRTEPCYITEKFSKYAAARSDHNHLMRVPMQKTKRTGWVRKGLLGPESIADHMYRMSMMALISSDSAVDSNRYTIAIALGDTQAYSLLFVFCH